MGQIKNPPPVDPTLEQPPPAEEPQLSEPSKRDEAMGAKQSEKQAVKVGEKGAETPPDDQHAVVAPGTSADAPAPLLAEHLDDPTDAYRQNPPPQQVGPRAAKEPMTVAEAVRPTPAVDARGFPVHPPATQEEEKRGGDYQTGTAPPE